MWVMYHAEKGTDEGYTINILKDEIGVNIVRTSHYPQSSHFLDRCDEKSAFLIFEKSPGLAVH